MPRLLERINFPKVTTILAITLVVAIGACGISFRASGGSSGMLALIEVAAIVLSLGGLVSTLILWIIAALLGQTGNKGSEPQRLFDNSDNEDHSSGS